MGNLLSTDSTDEEILGGFSQFNKAFEGGNSVNIGKVFAEFFDPNLTREKALPKIKEIKNSKFGKWCDDFARKLGLNKELENEYFTSDGFLKGENTKEMITNLAKFLFKLIINIMLSFSKILSSRTAKTSQWLKEKIGLSETELTDLQHQLNIGGNKLKSEQEELLQKIENDIQEKISSGEINLDEINQKKGGWVVPIVVPILFPIVVLIVLIAIRIIEAIIIILIIIIIIVVIVAIICICVVIIAAILAVITIYVIFTLPVIIQMLKDPDNVDERQKKFMERYRKLYDKIFGYFNDIIVGSGQALKNGADIIFESIKNTGDLSYTFISELLNMVINIDYASFTDKLEFDDIKNIFKRGKGEDDKILSKEELFKEINKLKGKNNLNNINLQEELDKLSDDELHKFYTESIKYLKENNLLSTEQLQELFNNYSYFEIYDYIQKNYDQFKPLIDLAGKYGANSKYLQELIIKYETYVSSSMDTYFDKIKSMNDTERLHESLKISFGMIMSNIDSFAQIIKTMLTSGKINKGDMQMFYRTDEYTEAWKETYADTIEYIKSIFN